MNKKLAFLILFAFFIGEGFAQDGPDNKLIAKMVLNNLNKNKFSKVTTLFDSTMASKLDSLVLKQTYQGLQAQIGAFKRSNVPASTMTKADVEYIDQLCEFEKINLVLRLGFNKKHQLSTLLFLPAPPKDNYRFPPYSNIEKYDEKDIVIKSPGFDLPGTITIPKGIKNFPIVILIHGSGPNGRDESIGAIKVFKDLAGGLATSGVGVIRYDKRTLVYGMKSCENIDSLTVKEEVIDDVIAAVKLAKTIPGADTTKIFLIGHSLGAMLMPRMVSEIKGLAGAIMMAGNARPLEDVYLEQVMYLQNLDGKFTEEDRTQLEAVKLQVMRVKKLGTGTKPPAADLPLNCNAKYWYDLKKYHQVEVAKKLNLPVLVLQGQRDYQVTMQDFNYWKLGLVNNPNFIFKSYPKLNHAFTEGDEAKSKPDEYEKQANVPEYVIIDILDFVKK